MAGGGGRKSSFRQKISHNCFKILHWKYGSLAHCVWFMDCEDSKGWGALSRRIPNRGDHSYWPVLLKDGSRDGMGIGSRRVYNNSSQRTFLWMFYASQPHKLHELICFTVQQAAAASIVSRMPRPSCRVMAKYYTRVQWPGSIMQMI